MSPLILGAVGFGFLFLLMLMGIPIGISMIITALTGVAYIAGWDAAFGILQTVPYTTIAHYSLCMIPLFLLMGAFSFHGGLSSDLYFGANKWVGRQPGGLAMATVAGCAGFAAVTGNSVASVATMGRIALPEMKKYNYDPALATGVIAAGGTMGILIPPSIPLVVFGILTEQSIGKLFFAGFIPGILEALLYMGVIYIRCKSNPSLGPRGPKVSFIDKLKSLKMFWMTGLLFILVLGGIYVGIFAPTEAAGIGAVGAFLIILIRGKVTRQNLFGALTDACKVTCMIIVVFIGAKMMMSFLALTQLPFALAAFIDGLAINRYIIMAGIMIMYLMLGCLMDPISMMLLTVPILFPTVIGLGFNGIWFGIIIARMLEIGLITPPLGLNAIIIREQAKEILNVPVSVVYRGIIPFLIADVLHVSLLFAFPGIVLFLPSIMN